MSKQVTVDASNFSKMLRDLARITGRTFATVLKAEAGSFLNLCMRYSESAKVKEGLKTAKFRVENKYKKFAYTAIGSAAKNVDPHISVTSDAVHFAQRWGDGKFRYKTMRGSKAKPPDGSKTWQAFLALEQKRETDMKNAVANAEKLFRKSRGLVKASWLQAADRLGLSGAMKVPAYVRKAVPSTGATYQNSDGAEVNEGAKFYIQIENAQPILVNKLGGAGKVARALKARQSAFYTALKKGVFSDVKARAQRYPGIYVTP